MVVAMQWTGDLKELTGKTITNALVRLLLADARREDRSDLAVACAKALRHPTTIRTLGDAAQRVVARTACANEINYRVRTWRAHGAAALLHYRPWAKYSVLVEAQCLQAPGDPAVG